MTDSLLKGYLEAALFGDLDEEFIGKVKLKDFTDEAVAEAAVVCDVFCGEWRDQIAEHNWDFHRAGRDLWLTRNEHGSGFWDGDWGEELGEKLTHAAHAFGRCTLHVDENLQLHFIEG
jgi:hypothetical protein